MTQASMRTNGSKPVVFVVDPDPVTGALVGTLLDGTETEVRVFSTAREFFAGFRECQPGCIVLEQRILDMSGLQVQHRLARAGATIPLVFALAGATVSTAVELMRAGAIHVLEKPVRPIEFATAIEEALSVDADRRSQRDRQATIKRMTGALSRKERQVLELIADGKSAKQIASELHRSVRAVEMRRASLMKKLEVQSTIELVRFTIGARLVEGSAVRGGAAST